jgi:cytochrome c peroxidase
MMRDWGRAGLAMLAAALSLAAGVAAAALPPVPAPAENPVTESKRVLGKILFWDEQLSSDNTVACGTCHRPGKGGGDPRSGVYPGKDGVFGTDDDTFGSPGEAHMDRRGVAARHALFGMKPQVGDRTAPNYFGTLWSSTQFWDGRAGPKVVDPVSGRTVIASGGALENQVLGPLQNPAEMAKDDRGWADVATKLQNARPLALATRIPPDMLAAMRAHPRYGELFAAAFGDPRIDAPRVAMAIATYERTLVPDQTPYDLGTRPGRPIDPTIQQGLVWLDSARCTVCHKPPLFTDNLFHNVGVRRAFQDPGRQKVTGDSAQAGAMKTPTLRNVALRSSFMHTGEFHTLAEVLNHYAAPKAEADPMPGTNEKYNLPIEQSTREQIIDFLTNGLTDPRVARETFPFDRPVLRSERGEGQTAPARPDGFVARFTAPGVVTLDWKPAMGASDYLLIRDGQVIGLPTTPGFVDDAGLGRWRRHSYRLTARNDAADASPAASAGAGVPTLALGGGGAAFVVGAGVLWAWRRRRP